MKIDNNIHIRHKKTKITRLLFILEQMIAKEIYKQKQIR